MTQTNEGLGSLISDHPVEFATAVAIGGVLVAGAIYAGIAFGILAAGDEAPIRVRNGSIELHVVHNSKSWKEDGDKKNWKLSSGTRGTDEYEVVIAPSNPSHCSRTSASGIRTVRFTHDNSWIDVKSTGRKSKVSSSDDLNQASDQVIELANGFVKGIVLDGTTVCTFPAADSGLRVLLIDP